MPQGTCKLCGRPGRYVQMSSGAWWVHEATGRALALDGHDINTHIERRPR